MDISTTSSSDNSDSNLDYNDINFRLGIMYDYMYNRDNISQYYEYNAKSISDITIEDIKEINNHPDVLKDKIKFVEKNQNRYIFTKKFTVYDAMIKIGIYDKSNTNNNDKFRSEVIDMMFSYALTDLIKNDSKFILMPIMYFDVTYGELEKINPDVLNIIKKHETVTENDTFYVHVMENYFEQITLKQFIADNVNKFKEQDWKILFFKILYALAKILNKYPAFRHNKLDLESIYITTYNNDNQNNVQLVLKSLKFDLPHHNYDIKITNFGNSNIRDIIKNNNNKLSLENNYYDTHYIFHNIYTLFIKQLPKSITNFIEEIIPNIYRYDVNNFKGLDEAVYKEEIYLNPLYIITKNIFFSEFIKDHSMSRQIKSNKAEDIKNYSKKENGVQYFSESNSSSDTHKSAEPTLLARHKKESSQNRSTFVGKEINGKRSAVQHPKLKSDISNYDSEGYSIDHTDTEMPNISSKNVSKKVNARAVTTDSSTTSMSSTIPSEKSSDKSSDKQQISKSSDSSLSATSDDYEVVPKQNTNNVQAVSANKFATLFNDNPYSRGPQQNMGYLPNMPQYQHVGGKKHKSSKSKREKRAPKETVNQNQGGMPLNNYESFGLPDGYSGIAPQWITDGYAPQMGNQQNPMMGQFNPQMNMPPIDMSQMPQMNMPQMNMPQMQMPQMNIPQMQMPQMQMPQMQMPQMNMPQMNMPQMNMPQANIPDYNLSNYTNGLPLGSAFDKNVPYDLSNSEGSINTQNMTQNMTSNSTMNMTPNMAPNMNSYNAMNMNTNMTNGLPKTNIQSIIKTAPQTGGKKKNSFFF